MKSIKIMNNKSNLFKKKLSGKKIGVFFGTMAPMHIGHQAEIFKAATVNDGVLIIVSGYTGDRGYQLGLPLEKRFRYLREAFNDEAEIRIDYINEDGIPEMPNGWNEWTDLLVNKILQNIENKDAEITLYTGEPEYRDELNKRLASYGNYNVSVMDRTILDISATKIRENPLKHWNYINRVFKRHFTKKVVVLGAPNTGKSTLIRRLARTANADFSKDYWKYYKEFYNVDEDELQLKDYIHLAQGQYTENSQTINLASNNGITFLDGSVMMTKVYAELKLADKFNDLASVFDNMIAEEKIDLILLLPPVSNAKFDQDFYNKLLYEIKQSGLWSRSFELNQMTALNEPDYYQRYLSSLDIIQANTAFNIKHLSD